MHAGLVAMIVIILLMAGVPKSSIVLEKKIRPGNRTHIVVLDIVVLDIVVLDFYGLGRHLVIDS